jgi:hypothetical protein
MNGIDAEEPVQGFQFGDHRPVGDAGHAHPGADGPAQRETTRPLGRHGDGGDQFFQAHGEDHGDPLGLHGHVELTHGPSHGACHDDPHGAVPVHGVGPLEDHVPGTELFDQGSRFHFDDLPPWKETGRPGRAGPGRTAPRG